jgi:hypothetical protein
MLKNLKIMDKIKIEWDEMSPDALTRHVLFEKYIKPKWSLLYGENVQFITLRGTITYEEDETGI